MGVATCGAISVCSVTYTVPNASAAATTTVLATLTHKDYTTETASTTLSLVSEVEDDSIILQVPRTTIRSTSQFVATAFPGPHYAPADIYIVVDGGAIKDCGPNPTSCSYQGTIFGNIGSVHTVYARIKTNGGLYYRSQSALVTLAANDAPSVTVATGKMNMFATETVDVTASANDDDGIASITIYQNDSPIKTCTGLASCTTIAGPFPGLVAGDVVNFDASATDILGATTATGQSSTSAQGAVVTIIK